MSPKYVSRDEVSQEYMDHEKEILLAQAKKENPEKPENIIEKMIIGRLNKEMKEICLSRSGICSGQRPYSCKICRQSSKRKQC